MQTGKSKHYAFIEFESHEVWAFPSTFDVHCCTMPPWVPVADCKDVYEVHKVAGQFQRLFEKVNAAYSRYLV